jgi:hypothetical protein
MKKFKNGFLALALVAGVSFAVASKVEANARQTGSTYNWTGSGTLHSGALPNASVSAASSYYGCPTGTAATCATGTRISGSGPLQATILKSN